MVHVLVLSLVFHGKYYVRRLAIRVEPEKLYGIVGAWTNAMWSIARIIARISDWGPAILQRLIVPYYAALPLNDAHLKEWARLDPFEMLPPRYDQAQRLSDVKRWFLRAGLTDVQVKRGHNGIQAQARRPDPATSQLSVPASGPRS